MNLISPFLCASWEERAPECTVGRGHHVQEWFEEHKEFMLLNGSSRLVRLLYCSETAILWKYFARRLPGGKNPSFIPNWQYQCVVKPLCHQGESQPHINPNVALIIQDSRTLLGLVMLIRLIVWMQWR